VILDNKRNPCPVQQLSKTFEGAIQEEESFLVGDFMIVEVESPGNIIRNDGDLQLSHSQVVGDMLILDLEDCSNVFGLGFFTIQVGGDLSLKIGGVELHILIHMNQALSCVIKSRQRVSGNRLARDNPMKDLGHLLMRTETIINLL
jgi:hypothetical protein